MRRIGSRRRTIRTAICSHRAETRHRPQAMRMSRQPLATKARIDMSLVLEQSFPLGRFHATRWNQNPFEDPYGEWPPSPWRLLRALAARWFQYGRETGDTDDTLRNRILTKLAQEVPCFRLPENTWRGRAIH